jgi:hypothetical protein
VVLASRRFVPASAQVQVDPAALPLDLIDFALAVVLAASLELEEFCGRCCVRGDRLRVARLPA